MKGKRVVLYFDFLDPDEDSPVFDAKGEHHMLHIWEAPVEFDIDDAVSSLREHFYITRMRLEVKEQTNEEHNETEVHDPRQRELPGDGGV